jgi:aspartate aminotransferase-like enzyme
VLAELQWLHGTTGEVFLLAASGTGAMEAAVVNVLAPGQRALAIGGGKFGERWSAILARLRRRPRRLDVSGATRWIRPKSSGAWRPIRRSRCVFATYSETSTGALHDCRASPAVTRAHGRRLVVDAVTGIGVHPLPQDAWAVDVVVCGSQKGMMIPPGIATVSLAPSARDLIDGDRLPALLLGPAQGAQSPRALGETAFTPPVSLVLALREALAMLRERDWRRSPASSPARARGARRRERVRLGDVHHPRRPRR